MTRRRRPTPQVSLPPTFFGGGDDGPAAAAADRNFSHDQRYADVNTNTMYGMIRQRCWRRPRTEISRSRAEADGPSRRSRE